MDYVLLTQVGVVIDGIVKLGYGIAGLYMAKTGIIYIKDFKHYSEKDKLGG